jgi:hypothetical protein
MIFQGTTDFDIGSMAEGRGGCKRKVVEADRKTSAPARESQPKNSTGGHLASPGFAVSESPLHPFRNRSL